MKNKFANTEDIVELIKHTPEELDDLDEINELVTQKNDYAMQVKTLIRTCDKICENIAHRLRDDKHLLDMINLEFQVHRMQIDRIDLEQNRRVGGIVVGQKDIAIQVLETVAN